MSFYPFNLTTSKNLRDGLDYLRLKSYRLAAELGKLQLMTANLIKQLGVNFSSLEKEPVRVKVCLAKAFTTIYFDPLVLAFSSRQWMADQAYMNEEVASSNGSGDSKGKSINKGYIN